MAQIEDLVAHVRRMHAVKLTIDSLKAELKGFQAEYDALRNGTIPDLMEQERLPRFTIGDIGKTVYTQHMVQASLQDKETGFVWLENEGAGDLITRTVHAGTLAVWVKERVQETGELPPDEIIKVSMWEQARLRNE